MLVVDKDACKLYEMFDAQRAGSGWDAGSGAVFDLRSNRLRPAGWTSADAAGLPIFAGLLRRDEVAAGNVDHAIRVTASRTDRSCWKFIVRSRPYEIGALSKRSSGDGTMIEADAYALCA